MSSSREYLTVEVLSSLFLIASPSSAVCLSEPRILITSVLEHYGAPSIVCAVDSLLPVSWHSLSDGEGVRGVFQQYHRCGFLKHHVQTILLQ